MSDIGAGAFDTSMEGIGKREGSGATHGLRVVFRYRGRFLRRRSGESIGSVGIECPCQG
jgi:hypothetical protein